METVETTAPTGVNKLYFAAWRWHFYAGLYVVPFLLMLAVTGFFMMLFTTYLPEYGDRLSVTPAGEAMPVAEQAAAALAAVPGATGISEYIAPYGPTNPALFEVADGGEGMVIALNPYSGEVLRQTVNGDTWNLFFEKIHGTLLIGDLGDRLIEVAATLGLLMVITGVYLAWPRNGATFRQMLVPDLSGGGRGWWKSLHLVIGSWSAIIMALFLVTGLAWAGIWGNQVQAWGSFPAEKWDNVPLSDKTHLSLNGDGEKQVPWGLEQTPLPQSGSATGVAVLPEGTVLDLTAMVDLGRKLGIEGRFRVTPPGDETGVWTLAQNSMSYDGAPPTLDRTVHVDQFSGKVLADVRYAEYSVAAKAMAVGIALHEGQVGVVNFALNALFCLATVALCVSGMVMWWKRRPAGAIRLAAPPRPDQIPLTGGMIVIAVAMCLVFPVLGLIIAAIALIDLVILRSVPPLKRILS